MGTKTVVVKEEREDMVDDLEEANEKIEVSEEELDAKRLADLKARMAAKQNGQSGKEDMPPRIVAKKTRSIRLGVIGSGQAGSRLAASFANLSYDAICVNTASQDLEHIKLPESNKLLLEYGLGGASKELTIGEASANEHRDAINQLVHEKLGDAQVLIFCCSLGGGSGAGSAPVILDLLSQTEKPIVCLCVLPMSTDDPQTKSNAITTLAKLTELVRTQKLHNLVVVDNSKAEVMFADVSQLNFFDVLNKAIVEPIDAFNNLSSMPSSVKSLDPQEFAKLFVDSGGLTVYGHIDCVNFEDETGLAECVINDLADNMLASGFDLKKSKYVGALFVANKSVWSKIPASSTNYALSMINDLCGNPLGVFRGIYESENVPDNVVKVYSMFAGLGLPESRVSQLKEEAKEKMAKAEAKNEERNLSLKIDVGEPTVSAADQIKQKIAAKKSAFGKLTQNAVIDRRKK